MATVVDLTNLLFADDIDGIAGEEEDLVKLVECLDKAEKTKLMTNNTSNINIDFQVNRLKLETVTSFKYLGSVITVRVPRLRYSPGQHRQQQH